jgi:hypothetical protein
VSHTPFSHPFPARPMPHSLTGASQGRPDSARAPASAVPKKAPGRQVLTSSIDKKIRICPLMRGWRRWRRRHQLDGPQLPLRMPARTGRSGGAAPGARRQVPRHGRRVRHHQRPDHGHEEVLRRRLLLVREAQLRELAQLVAAPGAQAVCGGPREPMSEPRAAFPPPAVRCRPPQCVDFTASAPGLRCRPCNSPPGQHGHALKRKERQATACRQAVAGRGAPLMTSSTRATLQSQPPVARASSTRALKYCSTAETFSMSSANRASFCAQTLLLRVSWESPRHAGG